MRRALDAVIPSVLLLVAWFYVPRLSELVSEAAAASKGESGTPAYARALYLLGLLPLIGGAALLLPCLTWFDAPIARGRRILLGILCASPLAFAGISAGISPADLTPTFLKFGVLCSLGGWLFGLPGVVANRSLSEVIYRLVNPAGHPKSRRSS